MKLILVLFLLLPLLYSSTGFPTDVRKKASFLTKDLFPLRGKWQTVHPDDLESARKNLDKELALLKLEERLDLLFELTPNEKDSYLVDPKGRISANSLLEERIFLNFYGLSKEEKTNLLKSPKLFQVLKKKTEFGKVKVEVPSIFIDALYGLNPVQVEERLPAGEGTPAKNENGSGVQSHRGLAAWSHRYSLSMIMTSYQKFDQVLTLLEPKPGETVVDVGTGYARMGFLLATKYPGVLFKGLEITPERVKEVQRALNANPLPGIEIFESDVTESQFQMPLANYYFLYDPVNGESRPIVFEKIRKTVGKQKGVKIIAREGTGDFISFVSKLPWVKKAKILNIEPENPIVVFDIQPQI